MLLQARERGTGYCRQPYHYRATAAWPSSYQLFLGFGRVREDLCVVTWSSWAVLDRDACPRHLDARVDKLLHRITLASKRTQRVGDCGFAGGLVSCLSLPWRQACGVDRTGKSRALQMQVNHTLPTPMLYRFKPDTSHT